jgi:two-component system CheB/CheR fusion protein
MQSVNEELQSTNEEMETSKEELQSINEELATVNAELQTKVADLSRANSDMNNLLAVTGVGTLFVDHQLRIACFTPAAAQLINVIPTDIGRPVGHIVSNLVGYDRLSEDVRTVLDTLASREAEVQAKGGAWYMMRVRPYRTLENVIEGAVITFVDITDRKRMEEALRRLMAVVIRDSNDAVTVFDLDGRILAWNHGAELMYGWSEAEALQMTVAETVPENKREECESLLRRLKSGKIAESFATQRKTKDGRAMDVRLTITKLVNDEGEVTSFVTTEREIAQGIPQGQEAGEKGLGAKV